MNKGRRQVGRKVNKKDGKDREKVELPYLTVVVCSPGSVSTPNTVIL